MKTGSDQAIGSREHKLSADLRDDLIEDGLEEMGLEARFRPTARQLIVKAIQEACI